MPSWNASVGSPSLPTPMLPVATPLTAPCVVVQHLGGREAGKDLDAERLGLLRQPLDDVAQADDVVAVVVEACAAPASRASTSRRFAEEQERRRRDRLDRAERRAPSSPGTARSCARGSITAPDRMCAPGSRALLQHAHRDLACPFGGKLLQADRGRQAGRAGADDHHVVLHRFARAVLFEDLLAGSSSWSSVGLARRTDSTVRRSPRAIARTNNGSIR